MESKSRIGDLKKQIQESNQPAIGVGPMSKSFVESVFKYSHQKECILLIIATRRQIEAKSLGHGYVNNWTTEQFSDYIKLLKKRYPKNRVFICRDHGGPWQGNNESMINYEKALNRALVSYETDILSDFDILHIDPSVHPKRKISNKTVTSRIKKIILHCYNFAQKHNKEIAFEIGTEETNGCITNLNEFKSFIEEIVLFCESKNIIKPLFVVGQTGSLVKELRQVGTFDFNNSKKLVDVCNKFNILFKEHNADYIAKYQLYLRRKAGIHAINVAPEFGVIESKCFLDQCCEESKTDLIKEFMNLSIKSKKWKKWVINEKYVNNFDKSVISGHYIFANEKFIKLKKKINLKSFIKKLDKEFFERLDFYNNK